LEFCIGVEWKCAEVLPGLYNITKKYFTKFKKGQLEIFSHLWIFIRKDKITFFFQFTDTKLQKNSYQVSSKFQGGSVAKAGN